MNLNSRNIFIPIIILIYCISISPLQAQSDFYEPIKPNMEGIDPSLPELHRQSLYRINEYRKAAGLPLWVYDASLSLMAQKHADYVLLNCRAGRDTGGHFERTGYPGYTKEGDEAARTSGLSGGSDPLYGLELLMAGPYHRKQFLSPGVKKVGIGFVFDENSNCSSTLFVSRPMENSSEVKPDSMVRFSLFPSPELDDAGIVFHGENPDPRPKSGQGKDSGSPVSVCMSHADAINYKSTSASMIDSDGKEIKLWISDPAHPFTRSAPREIYAPDKKSNNSYFARNAYCVFLMPVNILSPGKTYSINLNMKIGKETEILSWSFRTRKNKIWKVTGNKATESVDFITKHVIAGDTIRFMEGEHVIHPGLWFPDFSPLNIEGEGREKTFLRSSIKDEKAANLFHLYKGQYTLQNFTFIGEKAGLFYAQPGSYINLDNVGIKDAKLGAFYLAQGNTLNISNSRFVNIGGPAQWSFCFSKAKEGKPQAEVFLKENVYFEDIHTNSDVCGAGFNSVKGRTWDVSPEGDGGKYMRLSDVLNVIPEGETVRLSPGIYEVDSRVWINRDLAIKGSGIDITRVVKSGDGYFLNIKDGVSLKLSEISFSGDNRIINLRPRSSAKLFQVRADNTGGNHYFAVLESGSKLQIDDSDFSDYNASWFVYLRPKKPQARLRIGKKVLFPEKKARIGGKGDITGY